LSVEWCAGPEEELPGARRFDGLDEVARWLSGASLYIGNDSGITHLAAACGALVVAIFQSSDAAVWSPRGPHVAVLQSPDVREVVEASLALLRAARTNLYID
jgi:ADP-heptose:LPS heptosyltransferase